MEAAVADLSLERMWSARVGELPARAPEGHVEVVPDKRVVGLRTASVAGIGDVDR